MMKADLITKQELDHARYKLTASQFEVEREKQNQQNAEATLRALQLEQEKMRIVAPFDGVVARRYVRAGQKVSKDDKLFWVTATSPMKVKFALPEKFAGKVKSGSEITVTSEKHTARVTMVSPVVDPSSGTIEVSAELLGAPGELRPGMTANIHLDKPH
jgi:membrane fusion protein (multidrug efflux system)